MYWTELYFKIKLIVAVSGTAVFVLVAVLLIAANVMGRMRNK